MNGGQCGNGGGHGARTSVCCRDGDGIGARRQTSGRRCVLHGIGGPAVDVGRPSRSTGCRGRARGGVGAGSGGGGGGRSRIQRQDQIKKRIATFGTGGLGQVGSCLGVVGGSNGKGGSLTNGCGQQSVRPDARNQIGGGTVQRHVGGYGWNRTNGCRNAQQGCVGSVGRAHVEGVVQQEPNGRRSQIALVQAQHFCGGQCLAPQGDVVQFSAKIKTGGGVQGEAPDVQGLGGVAERSARCRTAAQYTVFVEFKGSSVVHQGQVLPLVQGDGWRRNGKGGTAAVAEANLVVGAGQLQNVKVAVGFVPNAHNTVEVGVGWGRVGGVHPSR